MKLFEHVYGPLHEAKEIKLNDFQIFYIDEIKDIDMITDMEDLSEKDKIQITLNTNKGYKGEDKDPKAEKYSVDVESLIQFMEGPHYNYQSGDYLDFMGSMMGLGDIVARYIEHEFKTKHYRKWEDFENAVANLDTDVHTVNEK